MNKEELNKQLKRITGSYIFYKSFDNITREHIKDIVKSLLNKLPQRENTLKAIEVLEAYEHYLKCLGER